MMMKRLVWLQLSLFVGCTLFGQKPAQDLKDSYATAIERTDSVLTATIYKDFEGFHSIPLENYTATVDSLKDLYLHQFIKYRGQVDKEVIYRDSINVAYFFDRLLLEYPEHHLLITDLAVELPDRLINKFASHIHLRVDSIKLASSSYRKFVLSYIRKFRSTQVHKDTYRTSDNKWLSADLMTIDSLFSDSISSAYWKAHVLSTHISDYGIKNIESSYTSFVNSVPSSVYVDDLMKEYDLAKENRYNHQIVTYKKINGYELDLHIFQPVGIPENSRTPLLVCFHGGSWTEGKPDYFFWMGEQYTREGWTVAVVEYRIVGRHGTLPWAAVEDARSSVRWLRSHSDSLRINPQRIVAIGTSAGGHLALSTALATNVNSPSDDLNVSSVPNAIVSISGVYDLMDENTEWIRKAGGDSLDVAQISPLHQTNVSVPPTLLIHGRQDENCPYSSAEDFARQMEGKGNDVDLHTVEGAGHFIWFGEHSQEVGIIRDKFLNSLWK